MPSGSAPEGRKPHADSDARLRRTGTIWLRRRVSALYRHSQFGSDAVPCLDWPSPAALGAPRRAYWRYTAFPCVRPLGLPVRRLASERLGEGLGKT